MKGSDDKRRHCLIHSALNTDISELENLAFIFLVSECCGSVVFSFLVVVMHVSEL